MKEYTVTVNGVETTMQLSAEDAKKLGAKEVSTKQAEKPANKSRSASNK